MSSRRCTSTCTYVAGDAAASISCQVFCASVCVIWLGCFRLLPPSSCSHAAGPQFLQKKGRACSRGKQRVGDRTGPAILSGSRSATCACLLVFNRMKPAYTLRTASQRFNVRPLMLLSKSCCQGRFARVLQDDALHACKASKGLVLIRVQRATGARSGGELGSGVEE